MKTTTLSIVLILIFMLSACTQQNPTNAEASDSEDVRADTTVADNVAQDSTEEKTKESNTSVKQQGATEKNETTNQNVAASKTNSPTRKNTTGAPKESSTAKANTQTYPKKVALSADEKEFFRGMYQFIPLGKVDNRDTYSIIRFLLIYLKGDSSERALDYLAHDMLGESTPPDPQKIPKEYSWEIEYNEEQMYFYFYPSTLDEFTEARDIQLYDLGNGFFELRGRAVGFTTEDFETFEEVSNKPFVIKLKKSNASPEGWQILDHTVG